MSDSSESDFMCRAPAHSDLVPDIPTSEAAVAAEDAGDTVSSESFDSMFHESSDSGPDDHHDMV